MKLATLLLLLTSALLTAADDFHVLGKIQIGGEGGWDYVYVDSAAHRLYVSHATKTIVVDLDSEKVVGEIADTQGVHGIAVAPKLNRGYTSNGRTNNVTVFDLKTLQPVETIATGTNPDAIYYEPSSNKVVTFNGRSKDASIIDAATNKVVATVPLGGKPEFSADDGKGRIYVNIEDTHEMAELDMKSNKVTKRYDLAGCEDPSGLAMDVKNRRIFSVCGNKVMVVSDPDAGKVVATLPIGRGADGVAFDSGLGMAFSSNGGDGNITVVHEVSPSKFEVTATVPTKTSARTIGVDPKTHKLYLPSADLGPAPAPTAQQPRPRPAMVPNTFAVLVVGR